MSKELKAVIEAGLTNEINRSTDRNKKQADYADKVGLSFKEYAAQLKEGWPQFKERHKDMRVVYAPKRGEKVYITYFPKRGHISFGTVQNNLVDEFNQQETWNVSDNGDMTLTHSVFGGSRTQDIKLSPVQNGIATFSTTLNSPKEDIIMVPRPRNIKEFADIIPTLAQNQTLVVGRRDGGGNRIGPAPSDPLLKFLQKYEEHGDSWGDSDLFDFADEVARTFKNDDRVRDLVAYTTEMDFYSAGDIVDRLNSIKQLKLDFFSVPKEIAE
jgi:hypothetical protein